MQNFILSLESQFPLIYSQKRTGSAGSIVSSSAVAVGGGVANSVLLPATSSSLSMSSTGSSGLVPSSTAPTSTTASTLNTTVSDEILPNKLPLKRRLAEFRFGRDGGTLSVGKKNSSSVTTFTSNPFAFDKFKDISVALTVHLQDEGVTLEPGGVGPLPYEHPTILHLLNSINKGLLTPELFVSLFEQQLTGPGSTTIFYDACVVVGVVDWRPEMVLTLGNIGNAGRLGTLNSSSGPPSSAITNQWTRRINGGGASVNSNNPNNQNNSLVPESHKVRLKPTPECWQYALNMLAASENGTHNEFAEILQNEAKLLEFERQLILINEPVVCLDPSPVVMYAMNALHFDSGKQSVFAPLKASSTGEKAILDDFDQTLQALASLKPPPPPQMTGNSPTTTTTTTTTATTTTNANPVSVHYRRIGVVESFRERERRQKLEPIYGIDHRRQFVKNRTPLPSSSFVPSNWRPFKTIRYEREILNNNSSSSNSSSSNSSSSSSNSNSSNPTITKAQTSPTTTSSSITTPASSLAKLYYCVNVFYAPPPTNPPIQLFLQVGTSPDTSTAGFLHRLQFSNLVETENYLQNLRNLLLIENGNCNLKVITDISTASTTGVNPNTTATGVAPGTAASASAATSQTRKPQQPQQPPTQPPQQSQFQLTPHQILQLNQQQQRSKETINPRSVNTNNTNTTASTTSTNANNNNVQQQFFNSK